MLTNMSTPLVFSFINVKLKIWIWVWFFFNISIKMSDRKSGKKENLRGFYLCSCFYSLGGRDLSIWLSRCLTGKWSSSAQLLSYLHPSSRICGHFSRQVHGHPRSEFKGVFPTKCTACAHQLTDRWIIGRHISYIGALACALGWGRHGCSEQ